MNGHAPAFVSPTIVAVTHVRAKERVAEAVTRIDFLDVTRGLFVLWMVTAHALTLAAIPPGHPLQWLRPSGWATTGFAMLSGFCIATLRRPGRDAEISAKLRRRAFELFAIAWISNFASRLLTTLFTGQLSLAYVLHLVTFRVPWTISGILIPSACLVLVAGPMLALLRRTGSFAPLVAATAACLSLDAIVTLGSNGPLAGLVLGLDRLQWLFGVPVARLVVCGVWAFSLAALCRRGKRIESGLVLSAGFGAALLCVTQLTPSLRGATSLVCLASCARFVTSMSFALAITYVPVLRWLKSALIPLGRAALLVFVLHRPLLQATHGLFGSHVSGTWHGVVLLVVGWTGIWLLAAARVFTSQGPKLRSFGF